MKQTIPKPGEVNEALRKALLELVKEIKKKDEGCKDYEIASEIGVAANYLSNMLHGRKGIGDDTVAKIDVKFPGWRDVVVADNGKKTAPQASEEIDEFTKQLLYFFKGMSLEHKDALLLLANKLHAVDNRNDPRSNPYPVPPKGRRTVKTQAKG
jgi:plasmid maintenance system antidote protein VapI